MENRKEPYGIKSVYWNRYCSGVSWTVTFHVYRFDFIGGMKDGMLQNIIDVRKATWYFIFGKTENYFKGKPVERQGRKARRD